MKKALIAPSILSSDFSCLDREVAALAAAGADILHLDIMDGHYVPNLTFGYAFLEAISKLTTLPLDAHLMVTNPADYIDKLAAIGVSWFSFHPETVFHPHRVLHQIREKGMKAGLALNPGIPIQTITDLIPDLDFVLLMSVNPGYSGQKFIPAVIDKVRQLKSFITQHHLSTLIEVDGGVNNVNAPLLIEVGADILVSASYIFSSNDYTTAIRSLNNVQ